MSEDLSSQNDAEINIDSNAQDCVEFADELASVFDKMKTHDLPSFAPLLFVANAINGYPAVARSTPILNSWMKLASIFSIAQDLEKFSRA